MYIQSEIPQGQTREDIEQRKKIIKDFYANWNAINPTKHIFNVALNDFIHVRFLSIQETAEHAAFTYKSTLAVTLGQCKKQVESYSKFLSLLPKIFWT